MARPNCTTEGCNQQADVLMVTKAARGSNDGESNAAKCAPCFIADLMANGTTRRRFFRYDDDGFLPNEAEPSLPHLFLPVRRGLRDKVEYRALSYHGDPKHRPAGDFDVCPEHLMPILVGGSILVEDRGSQVPELEISACCDDFLDRSVKRLAAAQRAMEAAASGFPAEPTPESAAKRAERNGPIGIVLKSPEHRKIIGRWVLGEEAAKQAGITNPYPDCPFHGGGVGVKVDGESREAILAGDSTIKMEGCCLDAIKARIALASRVVAFMDMASLERDEPDSDLPQ